MIHPPSGPRVVHEWGSWERYGRHKRQGEIIMKAPIVIALAAAAILAGCTAYAGAEQELPGGPKQTPGYYLPPQYPLQQFPPPQYP